MKLCVNSRQTKEYLSKADEILVPFKDRAIIMDLGNDYNGEKDIILDIPFEVGKDLDWGEIKNLNVLSQNKLILCINSILLADQCAENEIPFYFDYNFKTFSELRSAMKYNIKYVKLDAPLFFDIDKVRGVIGDMPIRLNPIQFSNSSFATDDVATGTFVRPEDVELYGNCVIEFGYTRVAKEQALIRIYAEEKNWPGALNLLIEEYEGEALNRLIEPSFGERRLNCGQRCKASTKSCHFCYIVLQLASMRDEIKELIDNK